MDQLKQRPIQKLKKTFVYSSEEEKLLIEGILALFSFREGATNSRAVEMIIENYCLPQKDKNASSIAKRLYQGIQDNAYNPMEAYCDLFSLMDVEAISRDHGEAVIRLLLMSISRKDSTCLVDPDEDFKHYFLKNTTYVVEDALKDYDDLAEILSVLASEAHKAIDQPKEFDALKYIKMAFQSWDQIGRYKCIYKALFAFAKILKKHFKEEPQDYIDLLDWLKETF